MSEPVPHDATGQQSLGDRRSFLNRSALMLALMAIAGGETSGTALAALDASRPVNKSDLQTLDMVLNEAIKQGSINFRSPLYLKLSPGLQASLKSLTPSDIATLKAAQGVLMSHFTLPNADDNNGTIGM